MKFVPPRTNIFSIGEVKYPSNDTGNIAPGMSVTMKISFLPSSFSNFYDSVIIINEDTAVQIPISAEREKPNINLLPVIETNPCWIGDKSDTFIKCRNSGGDGGFKIYSEKYNNDSNNDVLKIGQFTLGPSQFFLSTGQSLDLYAQFNPVTEGLCEEEIIVCCDNQTTTKHILRSKAVSVDIQIIEIDSVKCESLSQIQFPKTLPYEESTKVIKLKNNTPINVSYHWSLYKEKVPTSISITEDELHYMIEPLCGEIKSNEEINCKFTFKPIHTEYYLEYADFIVDNIPISAIKNAPENLKSLMKVGSTGPVFIGTNTRHPSVPLHKLSLEGRGNLFKIHTKQPINYIGNKLQVSIPYEVTIDFESNTEKELDMNIALSYCDSDGPVTIDGAEGPLNAKITKEKKIPIKVVSYMEGRAEWEFKVTMPDGEPFSFNIIGEFVASAITISKGEVYFGVLKPKERQEKQFTLNNASDHSTDATISLVNSNTTKITLPTSKIKIGPKSSVDVPVVIESSESGEINEIIQIDNCESKKIYASIYAYVEEPRIVLNKNKINLGKCYAGIKNRLNNKKKDKEFITLRNVSPHSVKFKWNCISDNKEMVFSANPQAGTIAPFSEIPLDITLIFYVGGNFTKLFICDCDDADRSIGLIVQAEVFGLSISYEDADLASKSMNSSLPGPMYKTADKEKHAKFQNEKKEVENSLKAIAINDGMINKTSSRKFIIKNKSGLHAAFHLTSNNYEPIQRLDNPLDQAMPTCESQMGVTSTSKSIYSKEEEDSKRSKMIHFASSVASKSSKKSVAVPKLEHMILSDEHEETKRFSSVSGETFSAAKKSEKEQQFYLANNKGLCVVCAPFKGDIPPYSETVVTITVYNNSCGKFEDTLVSDIRGLPSYKIPLSITIKGSPIIIPPNQVGVYFHSEAPTIYLQSSILKGSKSKRKFVVKNTGIKEIVVDWKIYDIKSPLWISKQDEQRELFKFTLERSEGNTAEPYWVKWDAVEPEEESKSSAFSIHPRSAKVIAKGTTPFEIEFDPSQQNGKYLSIIQSHPYIEATQPTKQELKDSQPESNSVVEIDKSINLGIVCAIADAEAVIPFMTPEKKGRQENEFHLKFEALAGAKCNEEIQSIILTNYTPAILNYGIAIEGNFALVSSKTTTPHPLAGKENPSKMYLTYSRNNVELILKFNKPSCDELTDWPMVKEYVSKGKLLLNYVNGTTQEILMDGYLFRPAIEMLTEKHKQISYPEREIDMGTVSIDVDKARTVTIYLINQSKVPAKWSINYMKIATKSLPTLQTLTKIEKEYLNCLDDPNAFILSMSQGTLKGPTIDIDFIPKAQGLPIPDREADTINIPQKVMICFKPTKPCFYKCRYRLLVEKGPSVDFVIKGTGKYVKPIDN